MWEALLWLAFHGDIADLGAEEFTVREAAEARLMRWSDLTWPLLTRRFDDCEQQRRARRIVARTLPTSFPPLSLLSGVPLREWCQGEAFYGTITPCRPGPGWRLGWLRPDPAAPLAPLIHRYGERARTQHAWRDWAQVADDREATRLLATDLLKCGVPPAGVRALCRWLEAKEEALSRPIAMERIP